MTRFVMTGFKKQQATCKVGGVNSLCRLSKAISRGFSKTIKGMQRLTKSLRPKWLLAIGKRPKLQRKHPFSLGILLKKMVKIPRKTLRGWYPLKSMAYQKSLPSNPRVNLLSPF